MKKYKVVVYTGGAVTLFPVEADTNTVAVINGITKEQVLGLLGLGLKLNAYVETVERNPFDPEDEEPLDWADIINDKRITLGGMEWIPLDASAEVEISNLKKNNFSLDLDDSEECPHCGAKMCPCSNDVCDYGDWWYCSVCQDTVDIS